MKTKTFLNQIDSSMFSENEQLILDYFCKHQNNLPYLSLSDICRDLFLSNATIVRFCQKLGFEGFNELKFSLRNELNASSDFSNSWQMLQRRTAVLKDFMDNLDTAKIETVCSEILTTKSLYIYGRNMSSLPAKYLYSMLNSMDIPCIYIDWIDFLQALSGTMPENAVLIIFLLWHQTIRIASEWLAAGLPAISGHPCAPVRRRYLSYTLQRNKAMFCWPLSLLPAGFRSSRTPDRKTADFSCHLSAFSAPRL